MSKVPFNDAQSALGFVIEQGRNVETQVYKLKYPDFTYSDHVPVVTEGAPWALGTIFWSQDTVGKAQWLNGGTNDVPYNELLRSKFGRDFYLFGSGYEWNLEEINVAMIEGRNIGSDKAEGTRRTIEQFTYNTAITGSTEKNFTGLINSAEVARTTVPVGALASTLWVNKTAAERYNDFNGMLESVRLNTNEVEYAGAVRLPPSKLRLLSRSSTGQGDGQLTQLEFLRKNNVFTGETNQELDIKGLRSLVGAGLGGLDRMMAYRNEKSVVRFHLPMPVYFLPMYQKSAMTFESVAISRTGGTEWRLPGAASYYDGV